MNHLIERINIYNPKVQGEIFSINEAKSFAQERCSFLHDTAAKIGYQANYKYVISDKNSVSTIRKHGTPIEVYTTTDTSIGQGVQPIVIAIYHQ